MSDDQRRERDELNRVLHAGATPCRTACLHVISGRWTALGIANVLSRVDDSLAASGGADQEDAALAEALSHIAALIEVTDNVRRHVGLLAGERNKRDAAEAFLAARAIPGAPSTDPVPEPPRWATTKFDPTLILPKPWADDEIDPANRGPWASVHCATADLATTVAALLNAANVEPAPEDGEA